MAYESHIRIVNGLPLYGEAGGITYRGLIRDTSGDPEWTAALEEEGMEAQRWTVGAYAGRDLDLYFWAGTVADSGLLIDAVSPLRKVWTLRAYMEFGGGTEALVEVDVVTLGIREFHGQIQARVKQLDAVWRAVTPETPVNITTDNTVSPSWSTGVNFTAPGSATAGALITIDTTTPSSGTAPNRYTFTLTNNLARPIVKHAWLFYLGNTSGWTGSTTANTFLFCDGQEVPRELIALGETMSFIEFVIDRLSPGQTKTYEILTGGTVAAIPTTAGALTGRYRAPVPDFAWQVATATGSGTTASVVFAAATFEANRYLGGRIYKLTGTGAGAVHHINTQSATTVTRLAGDAAVSYSAGDKFLLMASSTDISSPWWMKFSYAVRQTEHADAPHGILYQDKAQSRPGDVRDDAANSWKLIRSFDNDDDVACPIVTAVNVGTVDYFTIPNISRTWQHGLRGTSVQSRNNADGFTYSSPFPITEWRLDARFKNPNAVAKLVYGSRQAQAEDWTLVAEYASALSTLTDTGDFTYNLDSDTRHLLFAVWPNIGEEIPTSWAGDQGSRSGGGDNTMTDDSKEWVTDQWVGATWRVTEGKGQGAQRVVTSNDENTVNWTTALGGSTKIPNDSSRYSLRQRPLIANAWSKNVWVVTLDTSGVARGTLTSQGAAERVAVKVRVGGGASGTTAHVWLGVGTGSRALWVTAGQTVAVDTASKTAYVMSGATVVKDVTDWVEVYEYTAEGQSIETLEWLSVRPGASTLYTNRTAGAARHTVSMVMDAGYLY